MKILTIALVFLLLFSFHVYGESVRTIVAGVHRVSHLEPAGVNVPLSYASSSIIKMDGDIRFFRGIQLELTSPPGFLAYRGTLAVVVYGELDHIPEPGVADLECRRLAYTILPSRIRSVYQIPLRADHGLRTSPYATVLTGVVDISAFPLLFRLMPVSKVVGSALENMVFNLNVRPILSNEGALRITFHYPENLPGRPLTVLINDEVINNPREERILREGEHHLVILSEDYRNQSSRFVVERATTLELLVALEDTTPLLIFEHPEATRVYLNNVFIPNSRYPQPVEPGVHEVRFQVSDYTIIRPVTVQRGRTYRIALSVDIVIFESE